MQIGGRTQTHNDRAADNGAAADTQSVVSALTLTAGEGFIRAVSAVGPSITVPVGGDAAAARAAELGLGTCGRRYVEDVERHETTFQRGNLTMLMSGGGVKTNLFLTLLHLRALG